MKLYTKVKLSDIKIQNKFLSYTPKKDKINQYRDTYEKHKAFRKIPIIDKNFVLIDGYIPYLLMKEYGFTEIVVIKDMNILAEDITNTMYVYGTHIYGLNNKIYVWKVPKIKSDSWNDFRENIKIGDIVKCNTSLGESFIRVEDIRILDIPPRKGNIKCVNIPTIYDIDSVCDIQDILVRG